ncbi:MAG TPA: protein-L-isoaspartate(D-aspartate) O-methyltransferase [Candidatus Methylomirabilis sp.]|nr:protein-L-isoaspartate(D-aspartate) O-methyltransferase [Candidatus Methylomirabilis sp.]
MTDLGALRESMVRHQIAARGVTDARVLDAMRLVPREAFMPAELEEFAYEDTPLPIEEGQTISQPYIVALMIAAVAPRPGDRALEIGTGSGYAAAVLSRVVDHVYTVERHAALVELACRRFQAQGYRNIDVLHGDGSLGWPEHAPYDAIVVTAGGPHVPRQLRDQLAVGGRMVIPVGTDPREQRLVRVSRVARDRFDEEELAAVRFVPLVGAEGWREPGILTGADRAGGGPGRATAALIREVAEPIADIEGVDLDPLLDRIGASRLVLLGEASHGTSEFYRMRARITRELVDRRGFSMVAVEADWPDAARVNRYVRHGPGRPEGNPAFERFPTWMWRNAEVHELVEWLRWRNGAVRDPARRVGFYGLDLYSLFTSIAAVLRYLDDVDPDAAALARRRYACLTPWERDPAVYGRAALSGRYRTCEEPVTHMLRDMMARRLDYAARDGERFLDAAQNARLVADAERYYRAMYYGHVASWNLRDRHMFETLEALLAFHGPDARAVVWAHNSHVGNAGATEMGTRGEFNIGQLCRERYGSHAFLVGFGTDRGTVAAARDWGGPMQVMDVRPSHPESYERLFHQAAMPALLLPLHGRAELREELAPPRLERAIGVVYRPDTELQSHYFQAVLPAQFDEYLWFDRTSAVRALGADAGQGMPDTYPFGL